MIDVDLPDDAATDGGRELDRVLLHRPGAGLVRIFPREHARIADEDLAAVAEEVDAEIVGGEVALDADPPRDCAGADLEALAAADLTLGEGRVLPAAAVLARGLVRQLLVDAG